MKKTRVDIDPDNDILFPEITLKDKNLRFETHRFEIQNALYTIDHEIGFIKIKGMNPEDLTLQFGDFGHIHLESPRQVKMFIESINEFYNDYLKPLYDSDETN